MKFSLCMSVLMLSLNVFAETGPSDRVKINLGEDIPTIMLESSMGHTYESCHTTGSGDHEHESCTTWYVADYKTLATVDVKVNSSDIDLKGETVTIDFTGENATAITSKKSDLYFEIETEKKPDMISSSRRTFKIQLTLTPKLQSKTFAAMKIENAKVDGDTITFESLPETGTEMKTDMAVSEKKILFYSLVWWKEVLSPAMEVRAVAGKLQHTIHLREIPEIGHGKYRFDLYRSTKKANSLGAFRNVRLKASL